ncbi:NADPH:quinone reductase [Nakamurella deserti]|uniref:NADPH:quinone reductase n=1 Tax=Nakamurella deserti TaxID=2164074 RepID=UPI000DBE8A4D|nr:NADPH:quinone reductase [Nakamurella deserti]
MPPLRTPAPVPSPTPVSRRAAVVDRVGPADTIRLTALPVPGLGPDEVLVAVEAATVNPVDGYVRSGRYDTPIPFPFILGRDLVGTVVATGSAVRSFRPGDAVWANSLGHQGRQGSFTDLAVVAEDRLYAVPAGADRETLVAVAHPAITAYLAWFVHAAVRKEWTVYVGGAAGNVGTAAIQLARRAGVRVVAGCRPANAPRCRAAGADAVVDDRAPDLAAQVSGAAPGGVQVWWDTAGGNDFRVAAAATATGGRVLVTAARVASPEMSWAPLYTRDITVQGFVLSRATSAQLAAGAQLINRMVVEGSLTTRIAGRYPLAAAAEAHRRIEDGPVDGRLLVLP